MNTSNTSALPDALHPLHGLQLRLVRSHGVETSVVLPMVAGCDVDLAVAWDASPVPIPDAQRTAMAQCRIGQAARASGTAPSDAGPWWVANGSAGLACTVNQQRVRPDETLGLNEGDVLELGLMRFVVERCEPGPTALPVSGAAIEASDATLLRQAGSAVEAPLHYNDFELTNLLQIERTGNPVDAFTDPARSLASPQSIDTHESAFSDIADVAWRLDAAAPEAVRGQGATSLAASSEMLDAESAPRAVGTNEPDAGGNDLPATRAADPLQRLHAQYLRLMHNPHEVAPIDDWNPELARASGKASELEDLTLRAVGFDSLYDILGQGGTIGTVLEGLDTLSDYELLGAEPGVDVLRLFAPAGLAMRESGLPGLTRREHHMLSADSAAHLEQAASPPFTTSES